MKRIKLNQLSQSQPICILNCLLQVVKFKKQFIYFIQSIACDIQLLKIKLVKLLDGSLRQCVFVIMKHDKEIPAKITSIFWVP